MVIIHRLFALRGLLRQLPKTQFSNGCAIDYTDSTRSAAFIT